MAQKLINRTHRCGITAGLGVNLNTTAAQMDRRGSERLMGGGWYNRWRPICGHRELAWIRLLECVNCSNKTAQLIHTVMPPPHEMVQNITIIFSSYMRVKVHTHVLFVSTVRQPPPPRRSHPTEGRIGHPCLSRMMWTSITSSSWEGTFDRRVGGLWVATGNQTGWVRAHISNMSDATRSHSIRFLWKSWCYIPLIWFIKILKFPLEAWIKQSVIVWGTLSSTYFCLLFKIFR